MENVGFVFGIVSLVICMQVAARVTKMERLLKKSGIGIEKNESLYHVLVKNIGKSGTLTFRNGSSLMGDKKIICEILDVDEEWILLLESKKKKTYQQLLHIDSIRSVQF